MSKSPSQATTPALSTSDSGIDVSLLEEINRQVAALIPSPSSRSSSSTAASSDLPAPIIVETESESPTQRLSDASAQSSTPAPSVDWSSVPPQAVSGPVSGHSPSTVASGVSSDSTSPSSTGLSYLLLSNARRKLELDEERLEFEKEKSKLEKKKKSKKLFFRLSKRVKEQQMQAATSVVPSSLSEGSLKRIDEDHGSLDSCANGCNASTESFFLKSSRSNVTSDSESSPPSSRGSFLSRAAGIFRFKRAKDSKNSGLTPSSIADDIDETPEEKVIRLEKELQNMRRYAAESDAKCKQLQRMQKTLDNEVQDLTETLFQEAYKMANTAEARREQAEKLLNEALLKVDLLQAEVKALKEIVKSPAKRILRDKNYKKEAPKALKTAFKSKGSASIPANLDASGNGTEVPDFDPIYFSEFSEWRRLTSASAGQVSDDSETKFMQRTLAEDIQPCLTFTNKTLADEVLEAIKTNTLEVEPLSGNDDPHELKLCGLMEVAKECPYRLRTNSEAQWVFVSLSARNRIMAVCDFYTYLRYLRFGIVKAELEDAFLDIAAMRRNMALARFGFDFTAKMTGSGLTN